MSSVTYNVTNLTHNISSTTHNVLCVTINKSIVIHNSLNIYKKFAYNKTSNFFKTKLTRATFDLSLTKILAVKELNKYNYFNNK